jgi:hypothetical protein
MKIVRRLSRDVAPSQRLGVAERYAFTPGYVREYRPRDRLSDSRDSGAAGICRGMRRRFCGHFSAAPNSRRRDPDQAGVLAFN